MCFTGLACYDNSMQTQFRIALSHTHIFYDLSSLSKQSSESQYYSVYGPLSLQHLCNISLIGIVRLFVFNELHVAAAWQRTMLDNMVLTKRCQTCLNDHIGNGL